MRKVIQVKLLVLIFAMVFASGCASNKGSPDVDTGSQVAQSEVNNDDVTGELIDASIDQDSSINSSKIDRFESFNRATFSFNMTLDKWFLRPVAVGYTTLAPQPVETAVGNFFSNVREVKNVINDVLQWKWKQAANDTGRFAINSTIGIVGLFDVASKAGLPESDGEDFGQTLATWGVPEGPYLVLPFLGPYTVTSATGLPLDWYVNPLSDLDSKTAIYALLTVDLIHTRAELLAAEELISGDKYIFVRDAYLQRRNYLIKDGVVADDFGGGLSSDEEFDF